jgi:hypothetical protein
VSERERRVGLNEALFRQVNERLEDVNEALGWVGGRMQVVRECGDAMCIERISMTPEEYEELRADPTTFALVAGHDDPTVEKVVARRARCVVVSSTTASPRPWPPRRIPGPSSGGRQPSVTSRSRSRARRACCSAVSASSGWPRPCA